MDEKFPFFLLFFSLLVCAPIQGGTICSLFPTDDAFISSEEPNANFGYEETLITKYSATDTRHIYIAFDLSEIPLNEYIVSAHLHLYAMDVSPPNSPFIIGTSYVYEVWDENDITWNNAPYVEPYYEEVNNVYLGDNFWTITESVQELHMEGTPITVVIACYNYNQTATFASRENSDSNLIPYLEIEYEPSFGGGDGSPQAPYEIWTAEQMDRIGRSPHFWNSCFILMDDINLIGYTGSEFHIIGDTYVSFSGIFDGNYRSISNFTYTNSGRNVIGLFKGIDGEGAEIRNLRMINPHVTANRYVGALAGTMVRGRIVNCTIQGGLVSGTERVGALLGYNEDQVFGCLSTCDVEGQESVGGLVGYSSYDEISDCYVNANISGRAYIGGLVGRSFRGNISNCNLDNTISGTFYSIGGVAGWIGNSSAKIIGCSIAGSVSGVQFVGGVAGVTRYATVSQCRTSAQISGNYAQVGGLIGRSMWTNAYKCKVISNVQGADMTGGLAGDTHETFFETCFFEGNVEGEQDVGGLVGSNQGNSVIRNCYMIGNVDGEQNVGGLLGTSEITTETEYAYAACLMSGVTNVGGLVGNNSGSVSSCVWDVNLSEQINMCGTGSGCNDSYGMSTDLMRLESTFTGYGWDFVTETANGANDIWVINNGFSYPKQVWERVNLTGWYEIDFFDFAVLSSKWLQECPRKCNLCDIIEDGDINFRDLAIIAAQWYEFNCGNCSRADLSDDGNVDENDLFEIVNCWLISYDCFGIDIDFSGSVDLNDLKILTDHWLVGK